MKHANLSRIIFLLPLIYAPHTVCGDDPQQSNPQNNAATTNANQTTTQFNVDLITHDDDHDIHEISSVIEENIDDSTIEKHNDLTTVDLSPDKKNTRRKSVCAKCILL